VPLPTILIVEDDPVTRLAVQKKLAQGGFEVITAADGNEGLARAREARPQLIVADVMMPGLDGAAFCRAVRADPALGRVPVILLTAKGHDADLKDIPADQVLAKPCYPAELLEAVRRLLKARAGEPKLQA
jgi:CheY-like chemotaxis protein